MANAIAVGTSGQNVYARVYRINPSSGAFQVFKTTTSIFETYSSGNVGDYDVVATEQSSSGVYVADIPNAALSNFGPIFIFFFDRVGGSPADSDPPMLGASRPGYMAQWDFRYRQLMPPITAGGIALPAIPVSDGVNTLSRFAFQAGTQDEIEPTWSGGQLWTGFNYDGNKSVSYTDADVGSLLRVARSTNLVDKTKDWSIDFSFTIGSTTSFNADGDYVGFGLLETVTDQNNAASEIATDATPATAKSKCPIGFTFVWDSATNQLQLGQIAGIEFAGVGYLMQKAGGYGFFPGQSDLRIQMMHNAKAQRIDLIVNGSRLTGVQANATDASDFYAKYLTAGDLAFGLLNYKSGNTCATISRMRLRGPGWIDQSVPTTAEINTAVEAGQVGTDATAAAASAASADGKATSILEDTDATIPAAIAALPTDLTDLEVDITKINGYAAIDGLTIAQLLAVIAANAAGKISGSDSSAPVLRDLSDTLNRITATTDTDGNRLTISFDLTDLT